MSSPYDESTGLKSYTRSNRNGSWWSRWSLKRKLLLIGLPLILIIGLAVGLGVGLSRGSSDNGDNGGDNGGETQPSFPPNATNPANATYWKPENGTSWQIVLLYGLNDTSPDVDVYDIDLFDNNRTVVDNLHADGRKVICYFSAGSYENWRPDKSKFKSSDLGKTLDGWPNERWLDINSQNVKDIMVSRIKMAKEMDCDGVDPDNVDGYDNDNGLGLTSNDSAKFMEFLADEAHSRNMSIGLKNAGAIVERLLPLMQWSVNEQCVQYDECDTFQPFIDNFKPVFHIEYPDEAPAVSAKISKSICDSEQARGFSTVIKEMGLTNWLEECPNDWDAETGDNSDYSKDSHSN
jgi:endo-alpha-1,4-polygalactosaminidase (GH114 family)